MAPQSWRTLANDAVDTAAIQADAVTSGKVATNTLDATDLAADSVAASELADNAVDSAAIAADTITAADLAADAVGLSELADNSVDTAAIEADAVTSAKIAAGAVGKADVSPSGMANTVTIDPPSIAAQSCTVMTPAVTGIAANDVVIWSDDVQESGVFSTPAEQTTANQLRIRFCNITGAAIDPTSRSHNFVVIR